MRSFPTLRLRDANEEPVRAGADFVLYWMTNARRVRYNFALQRARDWALELEKPLVVLEALRVGYRWASDRLHAFVLQGMRDNQADLAGTGALYYPYVEPEAGAGRGLLEALAQRAALGYFSQILVRDAKDGTFAVELTHTAMQQVANGGRSVRVD